MTLLAVHRLAFGASLAAATWFYPLRDVRVMDGDTFEATVEHRPGLSERVVVRLVCSAPELREDGGLEAKARLTAAVDGGTLETRWKREKYGRLLGDVVQVDGGRYCPP
jgi:endonuclease YncB( thermonuclease family)